MASTDASSSYLRRLGVFDTTMVVIGGIIGAGIFLNPAIVAQRVHSSAFILTAWIIGGGVALVGALAFAELGARRPQAGGGYIYLTEAFGPLAAFLYGWTFLFIINSGGIAAVAVTFARYSVDLFGISTIYIKPLAVALLLTLAVVNYFGIRSGSITQNIFTVLKLTALAVLIFVGVFLARGGAQAQPKTETIQGFGVVRALGIALIPVLFAYGGWQYSNNIASEIVDPERTLPKALGIGIAVVIAVYVLANVAYIRALGPAGLATSLAPAADTMRVVVGPVGAALIAIGIIASTIGFVNTGILSAPRMLQAMSADGLFFGFASRLHPTYRTPTGGILLQAVWAVALALSGTYGQLLDYVVFGDWIFFGLIVATIFAYRRRDAATGITPSVFRMPGYPVLPALFVTIAAYVVVSAVWSNPRNALLGVLLMALGIPAFLFWRRQSRHESGAMA
ncbi:MAG TPA: amino acid permease [Gemmatimonadaceae bacterium]|jgi:APA family basic amino acid/polyamine antiporter|nr:amino acid permease [Gemmatimonadaceae bacterium]